MTCTTNNDVIAEHHCVQRYLLDFVSAIYLSSLVNIFLITMDRLIATWQPMRYTIIVRRSRMVAYAWSLVGLAPIAASVPLVYTAVTWDPDTTNSTFCHQYLENTPQVYAAVEYLIPLDTLVMLAVYPYILLIIRRKAVGRNSPGINTHKATMTSLWIVLTFIVCGWPQVVCYYINFPKLLWCIGHALPLVNTILDPLIYGINLKKIRNGFRALCACTRKYRAPNRMKHWIAKWNRNDRNVYMSSFVSIKVYSY